MNLSRTQQIIGSAFLGGVLWGIYWLLTFAPLWYFVSSEPGFSRQDEIIFLLTAISMIAMGILTGLFVLLANSGKFVSAAIGFCFGLLLYPSVSAMDYLVNGVIDPLPEWGLETVAFIAFIVFYGLLGALAGFMCGIFNRRTMQKPASDSADLPPMPPEIL